MLLLTAPAVHGPDGTCRLRMLDWRALANQVAKKEADAAGILLGLAGAGISTDDVPVPPPMPSIDANGQPCRCTESRKHSGVTPIHVVRGRLNTIVVLIHAGWVVQISLVVSTLLRDPAVPWTTRA